MRDLFRFKIVFLLCVLFSFINPSLAFSTEIILSGEIEDFDLDSGTVTLLLSVFNPTDRPLHNVVVADRFSEGTTVLESWPEATRAGEDHLWGLGQVPAHDVRSVRVKAGIDDLQFGEPIDQGAEAIGTWYLSAVRSSIDPVSVSDIQALLEYLEPTIDANSSDRFIRAQAAMLGKDPQAIASFVRKEIDFHLYTGSLRGARGTLWSEAGNALDQSSLLIALLRASRIPARYGQGIIPAASASALITSQFAPSQNANGRIPEGVPVAAPAEDAALIAEATEHTWVEYWKDGEWFTVDPAIPDANLSVAPYTAPDATFAEVPDALRYKITIKTDIEYVSTFGIFNDTVQSTTMTTVEAVGEPITVGHGTRRFTSGFPFPAIFQEYQPFVALGNEVIAGKSFQEGWGQGAGTLAESFLIAEWLNVSFDGPNGYHEEHSKTLFDRNSFVDRYNGDIYGLSYYQQNKPAEPALSELDFVTLYVPVSKTSEAVVSRIKQDTDFLLGDFEELSPDLLTIDPENPTPEEQDIIQEGNILLSKIATEATRLMGSYFLLRSDLITERTAKSFGVEAYYDTPQLLVARSVKNASGFDLRLDIRSNRERVLVEPGQTAYVDYLYRLAKGRLDAGIEGTSIPMNVSGESVETFSLFDVFSAVKDQGIDVIDVDRPEQIDALEISEEAKIRIGMALEAGKVVRVPVSAPEIEGEPQIAWWETDGLTGETYAVTEDGGHQVLIQYALLLNGSPFLGGFIGTIHGASSQSLSFLAGFFGEMNKSGNPYMAIIAGKQSVIENAVLTCAGVISPALPELIDAGKNVRDYKSFTEYLFRALLRTASTLISNKLGSFATGFNIGMCIGTSAGIAWIYDVFDGDPAITPFRLDTHVFEPEPVPLARELAQTTESNAIQTIQSTVEARLSRVSGRLDFIVSNPSETGLMAQSFSVQNAQVFNATGEQVATGTVTGSSDVSLPVFLSTAASLTLSGTGTLSAYSDLGQQPLVLGSYWNDAEITATGDVELVFSQPLRVNGNPLPAGEYTIRAEEASLEGLESFALAVQASLEGSATNSVVGIGELSQAYSLGGLYLAAAETISLATCTGDFTFSPGSNQDDVSLSFEGSGEDYLRLLVPEPQFPATSNDGEFLFDLDPHSNAESDVYLSAAAPDTWGAWFTGDKEVQLVQPPQVGAPSNWTGRFFAESVSHPDLVAQATGRIDILSQRFGYFIMAERQTDRYIAHEGVEWPAVYEVLVQNNAPDVKQIQLSADTQTDGVLLELPKTDFTLVGIEPAYTDMYILPQGGLPSPGSVVSVQIEAVDQGNPGGAPVTTTVNFTVPEVRGAQLDIQPAVLYTARPQSLSTELTVRNTGNVTGNYTLAIISPPDFSRSYGDPGQLAPGEAHTQDIGMSGTDTQGEPVFYSVQLMQDGELVQEAAIAVVVLQSEAAAAAYQASEKAFLKSMFDLYSELDVLGGNLVVFEEDLTSDADRDVVIAQTGNVASMIQSDFPEIATELQSIATDMQSQSGAQLNEELAALAAALNQLEEILGVLSAIRGDIDLDGDADYWDLLLFSLGWKSSPAKPFTTDLNDDDSSDEDDLIRLMQIEQTGEEIRYYYTPRPSPTVTPTVTSTPTESPTPGTPTVTPTGPLPDTPTPTATPSVTHTPGPGPKQFVLRGVVLNEQDEPQAGRVVFLGIASEEGTLTGFGSNTRTTGVDGSFTYGTVTAEEEAEFNLQVFGLAASKQEFTFDDITGGELVVELRI